MHCRLAGFVAILLSFVFPANAQEQQAEPPWVVFYQYAFYLAPGEEEGFLEAVTGLVAGGFDAWSVIETLDAPPDEPVLALTLVTDARRQYPPPDVEFLGYFGRGLTRDEALAVQQTEKVLLLDFAYPQHLTPSAYLDALNLMQEISDLRAGFIWDAATRELFTSAAWAEARIDTWNDGTPAVSDHIVIHAYNNGDFVRAITLGMEKFGYPDIVVNDFVWSFNVPMGNLINLVAQSLIEGRDFNDDFSLTLEVTAIRNARIRDELEATLLDNAADSYALYLGPAEAEEGDPDNFLLEIRFDSAEGETLQQQQEALLGGLFGWEDSVIAVVHDSDILAASERAREKLPLLRRAFNAGLEPGEYIHVKAPFPTPDGGNEWMWVEIMTWDGSRISGLLMNEPFNIPDLKGGSEVVVDEGEVFDYIRYYADGREEGNETGRLIQQSQGQGR